MSKWSNVKLVRRTRAALVVCVLACLASAASGCSPASNGDPNDGCTGHLDERGYFLRADLFSSPTTSAASFATADPYINGNTMSWYMPTIANACVARPEQNNAVFFTVETKSPEPSQVTMTGYVQPAAGTAPYQVALVNSGREPTSPQTDRWVGQINNIGLAQGSADGKRDSVDGWVSVTFPSQGTVDANVAYAEMFMRTVTIGVDFETL